MKTKKLTLINSALVLAFFLSISSAFAAEIAQTMKQEFLPATSLKKEPPTPPTITLEPGGVSSIDQAISHIFVTHEYQTLFPDYVTTDADVGEEDVIDLNSYIAEKNTANSNKFHINDHYEFRDPRITEVLIKMKTASFGGVSIHTDFANIFELGPDDVTTSDFNKLIAQGKFKKDANGHDIDAVAEFKKMLAAGFKILGSDQKASDFQNKPGFEYTISGPSVEKLEPEEEGVIYHLKRYLNYYVIKGVTSYRNSRSGEVNYSLAPNVVFDQKGGSPTNPGI